MSQNQKNVLVAIISILLSLLTSIASSAFPEGLKPYLWLSWPLFGILFLVYIRLQNHSEQHNNSSIASAELSTRDLHLPSANKQDSVSSMSDSSFREPTLRPTQSQPIPMAPSSPANLALFPLSIEDNDIYEGRPIDEPLPEKPKRVSESPAREKISFLPYLKLNLYPIKELPDRPTMLNWSPDGTFIACTFYDHVPLLVSDNDKADLSTLDNAEAVCWSPDSRILAVSSHGEIRFWDVATRTESLRPLRVSAQPVYGLDWSVRGQLAVWVNSQIQLYTYPDFASPKTLRMQDLLCDRVGLLRWSPDGTMLAAGATNGSGHLICWHVDTQTSHLLSSRPRALSLAWFPKSLLLAATFSDKRIVIWDTAKNQQLKLWEKLPVVPRMLSVSLEQRLTISSSGSDLIFVHLYESSPSARFPGLFPAAWSPTRLALATLDPQNETTLVILSE